VNFAFTLYLGIVSCIFLWGSAAQLYVPLNTHAQQDLPLPVI